MASPLPDFSIKTVNTNILNLIKNAGTEGVHVDLLVKQLGYNSERDIAPRLRDLRARGQMKECKGRIWKIIDKSIKICTDELPNVALPDSGNFVSFKNTLQEYCQKKGLPVPNYRTKHEVEKKGFVGTVTFGESNIAISKICSDPKDAESRVAFEALQQLGYLKELNYEQSIVLKRKSNENNNAAIAAKQAKIDVKDSSNVPFKSKLNEYAQKHQLTISYNTIAVEGGFLSTVNLGEMKFEGLSACSKRKEAERDVAGVALNGLGILIYSGNDTKKVEEVDAVSQMISEAREEASHPGKYKSMLQELCSKSGKGIPSYETQENKSEKTFQSTVTVEGIGYTGLSATRKKVAEGKAAQEALNLLKPTN